MVNRHRGEIEATFSGTRYRLCLTLGALAELESAFAADNLVALASRFESGRLSARDLIRIIGCGLRGGGAKLDDDEVAALASETGLAGYVHVAATLLSATFGTEDPPNPPPPQAS